MAPVAPRSRDDFQIAIICALPLEADAVYRVLDAKWDSLGKAAQDTNFYRIGAIGDHNVVVVSSGMGTLNASASAGNLRHSFRNIGLALIVGICGGAPTVSGRDIYLGDLVISSSAIQYDFGRQYEGRFERRNGPEDNLTKQSPEVRNFVWAFKSEDMQEELQDHIVREFEELRAKYKPGKIPRFPGVEFDRLYDATYAHQHIIPGSCAGGLCDANASQVCESASHETCEKLGCDRLGRIIRQRTTRDDNSGLPPHTPDIHVGTVACGDSVMKSAVHRDRIIWAEGVVAFEMEGAGVWDQCPSIIIKAVCDYADSHKSKEWQRYAATVAAVGTKSQLKYWRQVPVSQEQSLAWQDALKYPRMDAKLSQVRAQISTSPGSFDWVWSKTGFKKWLTAPWEETTSCFWITGKPGSGKSTLMEHLTYDKMTRKMLKKPRHSVKILSFFFDYRAGGDTANNRLGVLKMFITQLCSQLDDDPNLDEKMNRQHALSPINEMDENKLLDMFQGISLAFPYRICVFIDGLDEYQGDHKDLIDFLRNIQRRVSIRMCLASRPEATFRQNFEHYPHFAMEDYNAPSIQAYIDDAILSARSRIGYDSMRIDAEMRSVLVQRAQGVMIWARLAVDELIREDRTDTSRESLMAVINGLPKELEQMYDVTIDRLPEAKKRDVALILYLIFKLGSRGQIEDAVLFGFTHFICPSATGSNGLPDTSVNQSLPWVDKDRYPLAIFKDRLETLMGSLIYIHIFVNIRSVCAITKTKYGDKVRFGLKGDITRLSHRVQYNPPWKVSLVHETFYAYLQKRSSKIESLIPDHIRRQYPDAFRSRIYAKLITAATEDVVFGPMNILYRSREMDRMTTEGILLDRIARTQINTLWKYRFASVVASLLGFASAARRDHGEITNPYNAWAEALGSDLCQCIAREMWKEFRNEQAFNSSLAGNSRQRALAHAAHFVLPRFLQDACPHWPEDSLDSSLANTVLVATVQTFAYQMSGLSLKESDYSVSWSTAERAGPDIDSISQVLEQIAPRCNTFHPKTFVIALALLENGMIASLAKMEQVLFSMRQQCSEPMFMLGRHPDPNFSRFSFHNRDRRGLCSCPRPEHPLLGLLSAWLAQAFNYGPGYNRNRKPHHDIRRIHVILLDIAMRSDTIGQRHCESYGSAVHFLFGHHASLFQPPYPRDNAFEGFVVNLFILLLQLEANLEITHMGQTAFQYLCSGMMEQQHDEFTVYMDPFYDALVRHKEHAVTRRRLRGGDSLPQRLRSDPRVQPLVRAVAEEGCINDKVLGTI